MRPGQHTELAHLDHRLGELVEEEFLVPSEGGDVPLGPGVGEEVLVGEEEALAVDEVDVVLVVEEVGGSEVEVGGVGGGCGGTRGLEGGGEGGVHGGVAGGGEAAEEGGAVGAAEGVGTREGDDVGGVEVLGP